MWGVTFHQTYIYVKFLLQEAGFLSHAILYGSESEFLILWFPDPKILVINRAVDPLSLYTDPDPAVFLNADPDPDPDPGPGLA